MKKQVYSTRIITAANACTLMRILAIPVIMQTLYEQQWGWAFGLFSAAAITDIIDGWIARSFNQQTILGTYLDPIADKLLLFACYASLAFTKLPFAIPTWFVYFVLGKELLLIVGALFLRLMSQRFIIRPTMLGKYTTFAQVCFIGWFLMSAYYQWNCVAANNLFLAVIVVLMLGTLIDYAHNGYKELSKL